jgi:rubrerythrin
MVATFRIDNQLSKILDSLVFDMKKQKSEIIRDAIRFYAENIKDKQKSRLQKAIKKTAKADMKEYQDFEETINDSL